MINFNRILDYWSSEKGSHTAVAEHEPGEVLPAGAQFARWRDSAERYIATRPGISLGVALTIGVMVGWLIKRR